MAYNRNLSRRRRLEAERRKRRRIRLMIGGGIFLVIVVTLFAIFGRIFSKRKQTVEESVPNAPKEKILWEETGLTVEENFLTVNEYSRPGEPLKKIKNVVIHYTANPGTGADANRSYFEGLKDSHETYASSHFIIGLEGEIIQCIPLDEICYASNKRNVDSVSIECCHEDETGKFNDKTYQSLIALTAWLCDEYNLSMDHVIRHYDIKGKMCPLYYVEHEDAWLALKDDVAAYLEENAK